MEPQPPENMMDIPGMRDEMRRPMMLIVSANKKWIDKKRGKEQIVKDGEKMRELIHIDFQSEQPRVSARELFEGLEVRSKFTTCLITN